MCVSIIAIIHGKHFFFAEVYKNYARYKSENNYVGPCLNNYIAQTVCDYWNIKIFCSIVIMLERPFLQYIIIIFNPI